MGLRLGERGGVHSRELNFLAGFSRDNGGRNQDPLGRIGSSIFRMPNQQFHGTQSDLFRVWIDAGHG